MLQNKMKEWVSELTDECDGEEGVTMTRCRGSSRCEKPRVSAVP